MNVNQYFSYSVVPEKKNKVYVVVEHYSEIGRAHV